MLRAPYDNFVTGEIVRFSFLLNIVRYDPTATVAYAVTSYGAREIFLDHVVRRSWTSFTAPVRTSCGACTGAARDRARPYVVRHDQASHRTSLVRRADRTWSHRVTLSCMSVSEWPRVTRHNNQGFTHIVRFLCCCCCLGPSKSMTAIRSLVSCEPATAAALDSPTSHAEYVLRASSPVLSCLSPRWWYTRLYFYVSWKRPIAGAVRCPHGARTMPVGLYIS